jgi:hypothetical protein
MKINREIIWSYKLKLWKRLEWKEICCRKVDMYYELKKITNHEGNLLLNTD